MLRGIDVSNHQGVIDWQKVRADGIDFAFMKASEGVHYKDAYFLENWAGAKANGIVRGAYHYALPFANDARSEADYFTNVVAPYLEPGDMLALDMETTDNSLNGDYGAWTLHWLQILESYVNFKPLVYTSHGYIDSLNLKLPELGDYGLWLAKWIVTTPRTFPTPPAPWSLLAFWQYTSKGRVSGINGDVDMNLYNGDSVESMLAYGMPKKETPQPQPVIDVAAIEAHLDVIENATTAIEIAKENIIHSLDIIDNARATIQGLLRGSNTPT
jgi:lysozyme